jgi:hypothetical protein
VTESECYVGFKECGCAIAAIVDSPKHSNDVAKFMAKMVRDGLRVERKSVVWVRENIHACPHETAAPLSPSPNLEDKDR